MTKKFDARGEAAIQNLKRDPSFNEEMYRELGPVAYWQHVRARDAAKIARNASADADARATRAGQIPPCAKRCKARMGTDLDDSRCIGLVGHGPVTDPYGITWDHEGLHNGDRAFWRVASPAAQKEKSVASPPERKTSDDTRGAVRIIITSIALAIAAFILTGTAILCVAMWRVVS